MEPANIPKTAITTPFGLFEFTRMPFGLRNAAQTFQRFMDQVLHGLDFCYTYIDGVVIASETPADYKVYLHLVFEHFMFYGILISPATQLHFLGHHINNKGVTPLPEQVQVIRDFPEPTSLRHAADEGVPRTCQFLS